MNPIKRCKEFWRICNMMKNWKNVKLTPEAQELRDIDEALGYIVPEDRNLWPQSLRDKYPLK